MVTNLKNYLLAGLSVLVLLLAITVFLLIRSNQASTAQTKKILDSPVVPITDRFTDDQQENHAELKADVNVISAGGLRDTGAVRKSKLDTVLKALKQNDPSRIEELTQENMELMAENIKLRNLVDSTGRHSLAYSDKWLKLAYHPEDSTINLRYNVNLTTVRLKKKTWLFGSTPVLDIYADDPRATINGVSHFTVTPPDPLFTLTANIRTAYDFYSGRAIPSAGLSLDVGKFIISARYYWSQSNKQLEPIASIGYNFLKIQR